MTHCRRRRSAVCAGLLALVSATAGAQTAPAVSGVAITSSPDSGDTYELGEVIWASVTFDQALDVTGRPQLALTIGTATRQMNSLPVAGSTILFAYEVQSSDADANGVGIGASALTLNGGTIRERGGATNATLGLGAHAIANAASHKVDGSRETAPTVNRVNLVRTGTFNLAQDISVTVRFDRPVDVTGTPQLALTIGSATRQADYSPSESGSRTLWFIYTVQSSDSDADGISIGASALTLNGGTIRIRGGSANAALGLGTHAISNSANHKVDGGQEADDEEDDGDEPADNGAPELAGELPDLELDVGETQTVALAVAFRDPELDPLRFAASSDGDAISVRVVSGTAEENRFLVRASLEIRGIRPGEATVAVTATDPGGRSATATFKVLVGALLSLSGDAAAPEGGAIVLAATLNRALTEALDLSWRIALDGDPATPDADADEYGAAQSGRTTIPAGQTSATIEIAIADDDDIEPAREYFEIHLDDPQHPNISVSRSIILAAIREGVCDRTPAVRDALARNWRACHWPKPPDLAGVPTLDLNDRGINSLRPKDLLGLVGLQRLDLRGNGLSTLPADLFAGLRRLREVSVEDNPGAPFALALELVRTDAEPWAPGPATVSARVASGAPFPLAAPLTASPRPTGLPRTVAVAGGETTGTEFAAAQVRGAPLTLRTGAAPMPTALCRGAPCFSGFQTVPSSALTLFHRPPQALAPPTPAPLAGGDALRLSLASLIAPGDASDGLRWQASSSDESTATVRIVGTDLLVEPVPGGEGTAEVALTATDALGLAATVRFMVQVEFHWPSGPVRGWRATLLDAAAESSTTTQ